MFLFWSHIWNIQLEKKIDMGFYNYVPFILGKKVKKNMGSIWDDNEKPQRTLNQLALSWIPFVKIAVTSRPLLFVYGFAHTSVSAGTDFTSIKR